MTTLTEAENEALCNIFTNMLARDMREALDEGNISPLTTCLGMMQASLQPMVLVSRPSAIKLLRAYADCMEGKLGSPKYDRAFQRFMAASKDLDAVRHARASSDGSH